MRYTIIPCCGGRTARKASRDSRGRMLSLRLQAPGRLGVESAGCPRAAATRCAHSTSDSGENVRKRSIGPTTTAHGSYRLAAALAVQTKRTLSVCLHASGFIVPVCVLRRHLGPGDACTNSKTHITSEFCCEDLSSPDQAPCGAFPGLWPRCDRSCGPLCGHFRHNCRAAP